MAIPLAQGLVYTGCGADGELEYAELFSKCGVPPTSLKAP